MVTLVQVATAAQAAAMEIPQLMAASAGATVIVMQMEAAQVMLAPAAAALAALAALAAMVETAGTETLPISSYLPLDFQALMP